MEQMQDSNKHSEEFKPTGTIAFLIALLLLSAIIWFSVYNLQIERHLPSLNQ